MKLPVVKYLRMLTRPGVNFWAKRILDNRFIPGLHLPVSLYLGQKQQWLYCLSNFREEQVNSIGQQKQSNFLADYRTDETSDRKTLVN